MKRVFIVHGWGGNPDEHVLLWLAKNLEALGFKVIRPSMPDPETPKVKEWVNNLAELVGTPDSETYFIGHSIGCQTILRYLETVDTIVGGAVFIAGWFNLDNLDDEESEIARDWIENPIDLEKVKRVLPNSRLVISDNDPFGHFEVNKEKFAKLGSEIIVLHGAQHIDAEAGFNILPEALSFFNS